MFDAQMLHSGEVKILLQGPSDSEPAFLRVRDMDDDSVLWRLRSSNTGLRLQIKRLLSETSLE